MIRLAYDHTQDPPAPIVPVRIEAPNGELGTLLPGLLDSGADCTLIPSVLVRHLGLPQVDVMVFTGVGGRRIHSTVHAARVRLAGASLLAKVTAFGDELIIGRDLLNRASLILDGPRLEVTFRWPAQPRKK